MAAGGGGIVMKSRRSIQLRGKRGREVRKETTRASAHQDKPSLSAVC